MVFKSTTKTESLNEKVKHISVIAAVKLAISVPQKVSNTDRSFSYNTREQPGSVNTEIK